MTDSSTTSISNDKELERAIGANVRQLRETQGFKKADFAARCGISRAYLDHIEAGSQSPTIGMLNKVATALGVPLGALLPASEAATSKKKKGAR